MTTTSNDTSIIQYPVVDLIEGAARRCGKLAGSLSAEETLTSKLELSMMINQMVNEGIPLYTIDKQIYGLNLNQNLLQFAPDTVDLINTLYRYNNLPSGGIAASSAGGNADNAFDQNLDTFCAQTVPNGNISYDFTTQTVVVTVGMLVHATATLNPAYEYSNDGLTWTIVVPAAAAASTYTAGQWYWQDVSAPQSALLFRVRETSGGTLNITELIFGTAANEILLTRINRDDYQNLPFKNQTGRPLQFWFDRQIIPQAWFWPASQYSFNSIVVWRRRIIQNVGTFTDSLEFPNRFLDYILASLALRMIKILPGADLSRLPILQADKTEAKMLAWNEERDNSMFTITPMIGGYTQGGSGYSGGYC